MSLDIAIGNAATGDTRDLNWLRNPFGLCQWAEDNYEYRTKQRPPEQEQLYYVCNHWAYDRSGEVDRPLFKRVVESYWEVLSGLERGYYFFGAGSLIQFVVPHWRHLPVTVEFYSPRVEVMAYMDDRVGIPVEHFTHPDFHLSNPSLGSCKAWYEQLLEFAELLQDPAYEFYCSN